MDNLPVNEEASLSHSVDLDEDEEAVPQDEDPTSNHTKKHDDNDNDERQSLARKETQRVFCLKIFILLTALLGATAASVGVYYYARGEEESQFQNQFQAYSTKVFESFHTAVYRKLGVLDTFSTSITLYALENNLTFPFVTLPFYELRGASTRVLAEGIRLDFLTLVTDDLRPVWEEYTQQHHGWLDEAIEKDTILRQRQDARFGIHEQRRVMLVEATTGQPQQVVSTTTTTTTNSSSINQTVLEEEEEELPPKVYTSGTNNFNTRIYGKIGTKFLVEEEGTGPFMVVWQISPATPNKGILNLNLLHSGNGPVVRAVMESGQAVLGEALALKDPSAPDAGKWNANFLATLQKGQYRHTLDKLRGDPTSAFLYPVFDSFDITSRKLVGAIRTSIFWQNVFTNILPENNDRGNGGGGSSGGGGSIVAVLTNTHNQTFSYLLEGPNAIFLGPGDHHSQEFDNMGIAQTISNQLFQETVGTLDQSTFTQADLNTQHCSYTLTLYPSPEMQQEFYTNGPTIFALVVVAVFLATVGVFVLYDCLVEKRQSVVMNRAIASGALISSLFPEHVKDQLIQEKEQQKHRQQQLQPQQKEQPMTSGIISNPLSGVGGGSAAWRVRNNSITTGGDQSGCNILTESNNNKDDKATRDIIADQYENTSVLFCDLVGFTAWSATRSPEQVFLLLETIFGGFDRAAARRDVYKVETIGDCYVAVTGVPKVQPNHAVMLVRFAHECQVILKKVTLQLVGALGEDTQNLQARIGIHSGPVTAGVLRGQRSRFQLFGDTMNTASRCESNSLPGRIQITQETANILIARGKSSWLTRREDLVQAKGKGEMQFYWVHPPSGGPPTTLGSRSVSDDDGGGGGDESSAHWHTAE